MKFYLTFTKKTLFCILLIILLIFCFYSKIFAVFSQIEKNGDTHKKRYDYLLSIGCEIYDEQAKEKEITIPNEFSDVYKTYNSLQKSAGFDLTKYKNEKCKIYTYKIKKMSLFNNDDFANANLMVYNGRIIGGDVSSSKINGKMYPLKKYEKTKT